MVYRPAPIMIMVSENMEQFPNLLEDLIDALWDEFLLQGFNDEYDYDN